MKNSLKQIVLITPALMGILSVPTWAQVIAPGTTTPNGQVLPPSQRPDPPGTLDLRGKFNYYARTTYSVGALVGSAVAAGYEMANPPNHYPREWRDGGAAYGRNLGDAFTFQAASQTGKFVAAAALGEDPRYFPSHSNNVGARFIHALAFTFIDKSDHGTNRLAISSFAGAASAGFVGEAYLPNGFNDNVHAYQRCLIAFGVLGARNVSYEFRPELRELGHRLHLIRNP